METSYQVTWKEINWTFNMFTKPINNLFTLKWRQSEEAFILIAVHCCFFKFWMNMALFQIYRLGLKFDFEIWLTQSQIIFLTTTTTTMTRFPFLFNIHIWIHLYLYTIKHTLIWCLVIYIVRLTNSNNRFYRLYCVVFDVLIRLNLWMLFRDLLFSGNLK